jgi:hypothetical protein
MGQPTNPLTAKSDELTDVKIPGRMASPKSAKNVLMPDIYAEGHEPIFPNRKTLDQQSPKDGESTGFNPYDTGVLQKK